MALDQSALLELTKALSSDSQSLTRWLLHARVRHDHQAEEPDSHHSKGRNRAWCGQPESKAAEELVLSWL
jgi:hypothetical protein